MIIQKYNLNLIPDKVPVYVRCSQYDDKSRSIQFTIYNGDELFNFNSSMLVTVRGTKPDNTGFEYSCGFGDYDAGFTIQSQMTVLAGKIPCELRIMEGSQILGTCNFILDVEASPLLDDTIISETMLPLIENASQAADRAEAAARLTEQGLADKVDRSGEQDYDVTGTTFTCNGIQFTVSVS